MDKNIIKKHLVDKFLNESETPGIDITNKVRKESGKENKKGVDEIVKDTEKFDGAVKADKDAKSIPQNKFNYTDDYEKEYHKRMEISNGVEMIQYDRNPSESFVERAKESIEGSERMGNKGGKDVGNAEETWGASSDDFGKTLVKTIKISAELRSKETPTLNLRGRDIQADEEDAGHKPYALEKGAKGTKKENKIKEAVNVSNVNELTKGFVNKVRKSALNKYNNTQEPVTKNRLNLGINKLGAYFNPEIKSYIEKLGGRISDSTNSEKIIFSFPSEKTGTPVYFHVSSGNVEYKNGNLSDLNKRIQTILPKIIKRIQSDINSQEKGPKSENTINNNNKTQIKESMKRLKFNLDGKKPFNGVGNALKLIPEGYRVDKKEFEMTDGNETYRIRWEGTLTEGKAVVLTAKDSKLVNEDIQRMKALFNYKSQDTLGSVKGKARIDENKVFNNILDKTKKLLEGEDIESQDATEGEWEETLKHAPEAKKHIQGSATNEKEYQAPKPKEGPWEEVKKKSKEASEHIEGSVKNTKEHQAPKAKEGDWEEVKKKAPEATEHVETGKGKKLSDTAKTVKESVKKKNKVNEWMAEEGRLNLDELTPFNIHELEDDEIFDEPEEDFQADMPEDEFQQLSASENVPQDDEDELDLDNVSNTPIEDLPIDSQEDEIDAQPIQKAHVSQNTVIKQLAKMFNGESESKHGIELVVFEHNGSMVEVEESVTETDKYLVRVGNEELVVSPQEITKAIEELTQS